MTYIIWLIFFGIILFISGVIFWTLKRDQRPEPIENSDMEEWTCPSCSFNVQLGNECIYCGEKKPIES